MMTFTSVRLRSSRSKQSGGLVRIDVVEHVEARALPAAAPGSSSFQRKGRRAVASAMVPSADPPMPITSRQSYLPARRPRSPGRRRVLPAEGPSSPACPCPPWPARPRERSPGAARSRPAVSGSDAATAPRNSRHRPMSIESLSTTHPLRRSCLRASRAPRRAALSQQRLISSS